MTPGLALFIIRILLAILLYGFLGLLVWLLWQDVRSATRAAEVRGRRLGRLVVLESELPEIAPGAEFPLLVVTSLGRAPTNTAALPDAATSLEHALIHLRDGQWWLEDLESRNGTRLNDTAIVEPSPVMAGDVIGVGRVKLKVELE